MNYQRKLLATNDAIKANLLDTLHQKKPPAMLFTASHGMQLRSGQSGQAEIRARCCVRTGAASAA